MTSPASPEKPEGGLLHTAALIAVPAGAVGSAGLLLRAGQRNNSRLIAQTQSAPSKA